MLQLIKEAFFKHGDENILRTCIKALGFAASESQAELQDSANHIIKETADDLLVKLRSAVTQVGVIMPNLIKLIRLSSPLLLYCQPFPSGWMSCQRFLWPKKRMSLAKLIYSQLGLQ